MLVFIYNIHKLPLFLILLTFVFVATFFSLCFSYLYASLFLLPFLLLDILFLVILVRKLPWLSRQSDRLLTDRSLVRSQAEAPFLLFLLTSL